MELRVSWLRAYHTRTGLAADEMISILSQGSDPLAKPRDDAADGFYDIQALRSGAFATADGPRLTLQIAEDRPPFAVSTRLLAHASGFLVIRASVEPGPVATVELGDIERLERMPWTADSASWGALGERYTGSLRSTLNLIFLAAHERLMGRSAPTALLLERIEDSPNGNDYLHQLCAENELSHPFPVSYGTHITVRDDAAFADAGRQLECLSYILPIDERRGRRAEAGLVGSLDDRSWYYFENQSVVFVAESDDAAGDSNDHLSLVEFLTLRRGALRSIQRDTQRVLSSGAVVSRRRIDEWRLLLATTTDDYVLHDRISRLILPLRDHMTIRESVRDLAALETQVRSNIDSFQARIDLASQSASTIVGALFAVVAVVIGFSSILKVIAARSFDLKLSEFSDAKPWLNSGIDIAVSLIAFAGTWLVIRKAGDRLAPLRPYRR